MSTGKSTVEPLRDLDEEERAGDSEGETAEARRCKASRGVARGKTLQEAGEAAGYPAKSARQSADEGVSDD